MLYDVLTAPAAAQLARQVNLALRQGWQLWGGVSCSHNDARRPSEYTTRDVYFAQAVIRAEGGRLEAGPEVMPGQRLKVPGQGRETGTALEIRRWALGAGGGVTLANALMRACLGNALGIIGCGGVDYALPDLDLATLQRLCADPTSEICIANVGPKLLGQLRVLAAVDGAPQIRGASLAPPCTL